MKKISFLLVVLFVLSFTSGCSNGSVETPAPDKPEDVTPATEQPAVVEPVNVTIAGLKGPTSIGMIKMIDEKALQSDEYNVEYIQEAAPDSLTGKIINGDIQISSVPINLASVLYNKTQGKIQLLAVNTIGNLYIVGTEDISSISQLEGKTLGMSAKGSTPDFAMNYILKQAGLESKTELNYALDHATLAQSVIAEDTTIALLPQPFVTQTTLKNPNVKMLIDLNEAWNDATGGKSELYTGCIVINKEFAENNAEFVSEFLDQYESSVKWVQENQKDASVLTAKHEIMPDAALVEKALPYCGITFRKAVEAKSGLNDFYQILFDSNPASVGGSMPDDEFYFKE
ncbi:MAG TPA: sulfonate/nitrate/taurine transporter substrate-binding protein [Clostridiales bacterium]|jgi:NitT/TauT family transport system substrate-binding protein|nr:sulfonate/nitrate/taurine transporter substrate-binding protein [Clostridiales bacterium]